MTSVKLMGALPEGDNNGAAAIAADLLQDPHRLRPMIAIVDCRRVSTDNDTGEHTATVRVRRIEALLPSDLAQAERLLRRALEGRTGQTVLPLDLEDDIRAAFEQLDLLAEPDETGGGADQPGQGQQGGGHHQGDAQGVDEPPEGDPE
jgi:hypothetical protein